MNPLRALPTLHRRVLTANSVKLGSRNATKTGLSNEGEMKANRLLSGIHFCDDYITKNRFCLCLTIKRQSNTPK